MRAAPGRTDHEAEPDQGRQKLQTATIHRGQAVRGDPEPVPPQIFCAAALSYRDHFSPKAVTLDVSLLAKAANSPGRVFGLTERQVRDLLEEVKRLGYFYVEMRADLDQVRFREDCDFLGVIRRYYDER